MKKLLDLSSLLGIGIGVILIGYLFMPHRPAQAANSTGAFKDFPVGQARMINLSARREALEDLTSREQLDQMRDWLLFTAISSSGLSAEEVNKALFDLPPIRHGYMQPVANFEYGDTRSCYIGNGQVLALVPADKSDERTERLARIADEQRKNLGEMPAKLMVFEYELTPADNPAQQTAMLTRREPVNVKDLFTSSAGYYETKINSLDDLKQFMGQVDDLTYASLKDGLTIGGRKVKGHNYRGIRVEEIAAVYQSEAKIRGNALNQKIKEFNARCGEFSYRTEAEREEIERNCKQDRVALQEEMLQASSAGGFGGSSGFSLDPAFDYARLALKFETIIAPDLRNIFSGAARSPSADTFITSGLDASAAASTVEQKIGQAREGLARKDADPLFALLDEAAIKGEREDVAKRIGQAINESYDYQAARYIGEIKGTEAGMVMFYTDLLAKLWAINYQKSAPSGNINDFHSMTALRISSVYKQELDKLSNTRLWFGTQDRGFQVADKGQTMLFARTATRVYAASSNSFNPGSETEPNAKSAAFLGWWDNHYDEIARFEPEYERLNEIMKWSLVITWLNQQEQGSKLGVLQSVPVERGNWFPEWVKQHPQLRYAAWDKIDFRQRDQNVNTPESLPLLTSERYRQFGEYRQISGGVSLASEEKIAARASLSPESEVAQIARRSNLDYAPGESTASALKNFEGASYSFRSDSPARAITTATAKNGAKLRGSYGEIANQPIERTITQGNGGLNIGTRVGDVPLGELNIGNAENGFSVGWVSRDMDAGASLARRLSLSREPAKVLALDPNVEAAIKLPGSLPGNNSYFVKLKGSERWLKVTPESTPSASLESGYAARVGDFDARAQNYNLSWVKPEEVSAGWPKGSTLQMRKVAGTENRYEMEIGSGTFDSAGEPISIEHNGTTVDGQFDRATNEVSFAYDELPQNLRDDPALLRRLIAETKPSAVGGSRYVVEFNKSGLIEQLHSGDYRGAARELVKAPDDFKSQLDELRRAGLAECIGMMRNRQYEMASRYLDDLIEIHGASEELRLYKAVVELNVPSSTRNTLAELVTQGNRPTTLDELSVSLNNSLDLAHKGEGINLFREGDDIAVRYELANLDGSTPLVPGEPHQLKALIYVQDTPSLNNLDWQFSPQRTLDAAISGHRVNKLPRVDVARFKPSVIYDKAEGITFKIAKTGGMGGGLRKPPYFIDNNGSAGDGGRFLPRVYTHLLLPCIDDNDKNSANDDDCDDEDKDTVIVIVRQ